MRTPGRAVVAATAPSGPVLPARRRVFPVVVMEAATAEHEAAFGTVRETLLIPLHGRAVEGRGVLATHTLTGLPGPVRDELPTGTRAMPEGLAGRRLRRGRPDRGPGRAASRGLRGPPGNRGQGPGALTTHE